MRIRLISLSLMFLISTSIMHAQSIERKEISFAILGGVNLQNHNGKDAFGDKLENGLIFGYHAGFNIQLPLSPTIFFQPGLMFTTKGAENKSLTSTFKLSYIEMPLNLVFKGDLGHGKIVLGFGPYVGYGVKGKVIIKSGSVSQESDIVFKNVIEIGDPILTTYFRALDAGSNVFLAYEFFGGMFLQLNSQFGITKLNPEYELFTADMTSIKNTGFGFSMGYRF